MKDKLWWIFITLLVVLILIAAQGQTAATVTAAQVPAPAPVAIPALALPTPAAQTWTRPADGAVMVAVPAGEFLMGSPDGEGQDNEHPQHTVTLDAFWIDRTEVTNAQYRRCLDAGACEKPGSWYDKDYNVEDQPVVDVDWNGAVAYCAWAGGQLPTEAQWEKAARGTDGRTYPWGNEDPTCARANYGDCVGETEPVGSHPAGASPYGALDMAGNVWEWVADWYAADFYAGSPQQNPTGPDSGDFKLLRGGAPSYVQDTTRCANRFWNDPYFRIFGGLIGFRCSVSSTSSLAESSATSVPPEVTAEPAAAVTAAPGTPVATRTREADGMVMVSVPAGEFLMGSPAGEGSDAEYPQHTVSLDAFWIDRTEVTNAQYGGCLDAGACEKPESWDDKDRNGADQPVVNVTWNDAMAYCAWAGVRLPTEAEWEKAARGSDGRTYPWGNADPTCERANTHGCLGKTAPVGSYAAGASPYGALDMAGNVHEWVADWYANDYYAHSPQQNPTGPDSGDERGLRGGAWYLEPVDARCASRYAYYPDTQSLDTGFRCCVSATSSP